MELAVKNREGGDTGRTVELPTDIFGLEEPNDHAIYQDVRYIQANRRQGTHKSKERGEVKGSNKKPYRQKGTGSARAGHKRSPLWRHGGTIFGPRPRNYNFRLNKKVKRLARASALTYKAREAQITVLENFTFEDPRTKDYIALMKNLGLYGVKTLMVLPEQDPNVFLSGRNIPKVEVIPADELNTYAILHADNLIIVEDAIEVIKQKFS